MKQRLRVSLYPDEVVISSQTYNKCLVVAISGCAGFKVREGDKRKADVELEVDCFLGVVECQNRYLLFGVTASVPGVEEVEEVKEVVLVGGTYSEIRQTLEKFKVRDELCVVQRILEGKKELIGRKRDCAEVLLTEGGHRDEDEDKEAGESAERLFCRTVRKLFEAGGFYKSEKVDLGGSLGRGKPAAESPFWWNGHMIRDVPILASPVIRGFVGAASARLGDKDSTSTKMIDFVESFVGFEKLFQTVRVVLVSRRSCKREGLRYLRRGVDKEGHVANFVETTQLVLRGKVVIGRYTIVRGSIPLFFWQDSSKLQPKPEVLRSREENLEALRNHFELLKVYGRPVTCVSLVDKTSREADLGGLYCELAKEAGIPFVWFDFHAACAGLRYENVGRLDDDNTVRTALRDNHVLRVNCLDSLDRTNIVCKHFCDIMAQRQLGSLALDWPAFKQSLAALWADNGDLLSRQYTQTDAMKGDYTRTEKRSYSGAVNDGVVSVSRFYHGYLTDRHTQRVIDRLLGLAKNEGL